MRRTKIICTIGPATIDSDIVRRLVSLGMDVARLNFSHGDYEFHERACCNVRMAASKLNRNVAVMMDLQGPKMRTGPLKDNAPVMLEPGAAFCITTEPMQGDADCVSTTYEQLPYDLRQGNLILIADGALELEVTQVDAPRVHCKVLKGGMLGEHKGINLPGAHISAPSLTEKDVADLEFGLNIGVDLVALSFVRSAQDLLTLRGHMDRLGGHAGIIAKIERPEAFEQFDAILSQADAVMVARGDLGVEVDLERVPQIQKELIRKCNDRGVPVVTATQMLESMITNPRPTRAEVADIANAIYDGTDAVMLSGETATGAHPLEAVSVMARVADQADNAVAQQPSAVMETRLRETQLRRGYYTNAIGQAVAWMTQVIEVKRIVCFTRSGYTAHTIARYRAAPPITAITMTDEVKRRCALIWGVDALQSVQVVNTDEMVEQVDRLLQENSLAQPGELVIIVASSPVGKGGRTNLLKLHTIGESD